jgi:predicted nucleic acid-binding protein
LIVVDTTVLLYAVGGEHRYAEPSERLLDAVAHGKVSATTTFEVIQEFVHVRARRRGRRDAVAVGRNFARLLSPLLAFGEADLDRGLRLFERHEPIGAFDAFLAAAAIAAGAEALVSGDDGFASVKGLRHVEPSLEEIDALVRA